MESEGQLEETPVSGAVPYLLCAFHTLQALPRTCTEWEWVGSLIGQIQLPPQHQGPRDVRSGHRALQHLGRVQRRHLF